MKTIDSLRKTAMYTVVGLLLSASISNAQSSANKRKVLIDISHGQRFWNDPSIMSKSDAALVERIKYMTDQISQTAASVNAEIGYLADKITPENLAQGELLFIHLPSTKYEQSEVSAIKQYLQKGGAMFLVMDVDFWSTLDQTNVNDIVNFAGIKFGSDSKDTLSGGYTKASPITDKKLKVTYHGARTVSGGTPFCFNNESNEPFGTFTQLKNGGKIVVMGDGMVSLYMTSWKDVDDYQCQEFMKNVFAWLIE